MRYLEKIISEMTPEELLSEVMGQAGIASDSPKEESEIIRRIKLGRTMAAKNEALKLALENLLSASQYYFDHSDADKERTSLEMIGALIAARSILKIITTSKNND
jgi:hypothetical protein